MTHRTEDGEIIDDALTTLAWQRRRIAELEAALRLFLADDRFVVQVGGNPIAVEEMLAQATAALEGRK